MKNMKMTTLAATAALMAIAGVAHAAPYELNIYGASAQYDYWNAQAQNYAQNKLGCNATAPAIHTSKKHGFVSATNCTSTLVPVNAATGKRDLDIRYSGIASGEGILAVQKKAPISSSLATGCNINNGERLMYATNTTLTCKQVHVGTSDVAAESLTQISKGNTLGPMGGDPLTSDLPSKNITSDGLIPNNTVVVPFGFFINSAVTAQTCTAGLIGNYCTAASQCNSGPSTTDGVCGAATTITNISRQEAALIFSNSIFDWSDLGAYFTAQPTVVCLRHAGSGTHSALDNTVIYSNWGGGLPTEEVADSVWFNQGSSDEMKCINGATTATPTGSLIGAIGYADADQAIGVAGTSQNVKQLKYNGFYPTRTAIRNGLYDFYTNAWLYTNPANSAQVNAIINDASAGLIAFAQDPANVPASKANYWAAVGEMKFNRAADNSYPAFTGAAIPMTP